MDYFQRPTSVDGAVLWRRTVGADPETTRILPDGCIDLIWDGSRLSVAGPDSAARWHGSEAGTRYVALRMSGGNAPAWLGVAAESLRDRTWDLDDLWPSGRARGLAEKVATDPAAALEQWAVVQARAGARDPFGSRVSAMAAAGTPVATMAERLGLSARHLHRRCLAAFGYGPRRLVRIMRLRRAIEEARTGVALARVAAGCGYADQAHLCREMRDLAAATPTELVAESALG